MPVKATVPVKAIVASVALASAPGVASAPDAGVFMVKTPCGSGVVPVYFENGRAKVAKESAIQICGKAFSSDFVDLAIQSKDDKSAEIIGVLVDSAAVVRIGKSQESYETLESGNGLIFRYILNSIVPGRAQFPQPGTLILERLQRQPRRRHIHKTRT